MESSVETKKTIITKTMVLHFLPDSREISFRIDDYPSQIFGLLLPIGAEEF
jgi:hypothetical protein